MQSYILIVFPTNRNKKYSNIGNTVNTQNIDNRNNLHAHMPI